MTAFRSAVRSLRSRPRTTALAIGLLAVGIGANVVLFAVADAVIFRPFPFADPHRLVIGGALHAGARSEVPYPDFVDFRARTHSFVDLSAMASSNWTSTVRAAEPIPIDYRAVSGNFFDVLGAHAAFGRTLTAADDRRGAALAIVLSAAYWRAHFGGDRGVIGRSLVAGGREYTIVGVMPPAFTYPERPDGWVAIVPAVERFPIPGHNDFVDDRQVSVLLLVGRLRRGVAVADARKDLDRIARELAATWHRAPDSATALAPLVDDALASARAGLWALLAAVALLLAAAAANVAGLMLVEFSARRREYAIRSALGAPAWTIALDLFCEAVLLTVAASACALLVADVLLPIIVATIPQDLPRLEQTVIGLRVVVYTLCAGGFVVGACTVLPLVTMRSTPVEQALRSGGRTTDSARHRRVRQVVVASEVAIAVAILCGAALLYRSVTMLDRLDVGFEPSRLVAVDVQTPSSVDREDAAAVRRFYLRAIDVLRASPGVESAAGVAGRPLKGPIGLDSSWQREGQNVEDAKRNPWVNLETVTPSYFATMGIRVREGRAFTDDDRNGSAPVAIVGETFAHRTWPGESAVGKRIRGHDFAGPSPRPWMTVVGVVADVRYRALPAPSLDVYVPYDQSPFEISDLVVRTRAPAASSVGGVRAALRTVDPDGLLVIASMADEVARAQAPWRANLAFLTAFASLTAAIAIVGVYGVFAASVAERTHELGVRRALGASGTRLAGGVLATAARTIGAGAAVGILAAVASSRLLRGLLFGVSPLDARTIGAAALTLLVVGLAACLIPACRAARVDPLVSLRTE